MHWHSSTGRPKNPRFEKILQKKLKLEISIEKLCAEAGISITTYYRIAAGKVTPRPSTLRKLAKALRRLEGEDL